MGEMLLNYSRKNSLTVAPYSGEEIWRRLFPSATILLGHPDSFTEVQQEIYRKAVVNAQLLNPSNNTGGRHLEFVRESEASVHWSLVVQRPDLGVSCMFDIVVDD